MTELFIIVTILSLSVVALLHAARFLEKMIGRDQAWSRVKPAKNTPFTLPMFVAALVIAVVLSATFYQISQVRAQSSGLSVEILAGYNLVVDSNVQSPSTMGPSAATVAGRVCNTTGTTLTNVVVNIGDYTGGSGTTGIYPSRDSTQPAFQTEHPALANSGSYAFTHEGGSLGLSDAGRNVGDLGPGQCTTQYWTFSYPRCENSEEPPCSGAATWGDSVKPEDDLHLDFDVWATSDDTTPADATWTMWMRNEISAMANKIQPNGNPGGLWFNTDPTTIVPGGVITTNGILYRIGNVRFGFDNDGDYLPDYNFWVQPIGDAVSFDPGCFRLIRTSGVITVEGQGATSFTFEDQLYFTYPDIPPDNTNVIGEVFYTYVALGANCSVTPSPYQEAASGYDNEKFNADYGAGGTTPMSVEQAEVTIDKSGNPDMVNLGAVITYTMPFANQSATESAGLTFYSGAPVNNPLVISDSIPAGTQYITGSATSSLTSSNVSIRYSTDYGQTWSNTEPSPAAGVTTIQWWLDDALPPKVSGTASFAVRVPLAYSGPPVIDNCANAQFGEGPSFAEACDNTVVQGNNSIGDEVWRDEDADGLRDPGETVIGNIGVSLYWDQNGDGVLDNQDVLVMTTTTGITSTGNYLFSNLADGNYLVQVDRQDPNRPTGYSITTGDTFAIDLDSSGSVITPVNYLDADFGFGPALSVNKTLIDSAAYEGRDITYKIKVQNLRPGNGTGSASSCTFMTWATAEDLTHSSGWNLPGRAFGTNEADGQYADTAISSNEDTIAGTSFNLGSVPGNITQVEAVYNIYLGNALTDEDIVGNLYYNGTLSSTHTFSNTQVNNYGPGSSHQGLLAWDVTGIRNWQTSDFNSSSFSLEFSVQKTGGAGGELIYLDAMGFRITTDETCGGADDTLNPVPLSDTFDANLLEFVSASPPEISVTTGGTSPYANTGLITWNNLGPLHAGQTKEITVTFRGLDPGSTPVPLTNTAAVNNAYFVTGDPANDDEDDAVTTITATGSISGVVWSDDGDGWLATVGYESNGDDHFIPNVQVVLYQCTGDDTLNAGQSCGGGSNSGIWTAVATTTTNLNGQYLFEGLLNGYYRVVVDDSTIFGGSPAQTGDPDVTTGTCGASCDDQWGASGNILSTLRVINNANHITNGNFGYTLNPAIYGTIWQDYNADGIIDADEPYLDNGTAGITVTLATAGGVISTTQTDSNGYYEFPNLTAGVLYTITVNTSTLPGGATAWTNTYDPDDGTAGPNSRYPLTTTLSAGEISGSHDFGYRGNADIGDTVYTDWNGDGNQDTNENGIQGLTVYLYRDENNDGEINNGDTLVMTDTTDASGQYLFQNIPGDDWIVSVDESSLTAYDQTDDRDTTMDGKTAFATTGITDVLDADFGYQPAGTASIGDTVWRDMDANGIQSGSRETGIANIAVTLYVDVDGDGALNLSQDAIISTTVTDANGNYLFENLISATYFVDVDTDDSDLVINGSMYRLTTNNDPLTVTLTTGQSYLDADFGFAPPATIGDTIYQDNNRNGQYDVGEPGIQGVTVRLYIDENNNGVYNSGTDTLYATDVTDANGNYLFTDLPSDLYIVVVDENSAAISGWQQTGDPDHFAVCEDPDTNGFTYDDCNAESAVLGFTQDMHGNTLINPIRLGQTDLTRDFGYLPPRAIGDRVWLDYLGDGIDDYNGDGLDDEPGLGGVDVQLIFGGGVIATTTTDSEGYYGFGGDILNNDGAYTIRVVTTTLPATMTQTYDLDNLVLDHQTTVTITSSPYFTNVIDFGYRYAGPYSITGTVFFDQGNIGDTLTDTFTAGDTPYANITVYLFDENRRQIDETTTDATGHYTFTNLFGGGITYTVSVDITDSQIADQILTASPDGDHSYYSVNITSTNVGDIDFGFFEDRPILNISKSVDPTGEISPGDTLTYTITVSNSGTLTATNAIISDTLPAEVSANAITVTITPPGNGTVSTTPPALVSGVTITPGETITLTVVVTADLGLPGGTIITNTASVTSSEVLTPVVSPPVTNTIPYTADLEIVKTDDPDPVVPGGVLTYTLAYTNNGPGNAQNVYITDTLPVSVTFGGVVSENPAVSGPTQTGQLLTWFTPTLLAGATGELVYTVTVDSAVTTFTNSVSITSTTTDGNPNNNDDDEPTSIETADLSLDKSVDNTTPNVGEVITFTIVVNNAGPQNATNVEVVDGVPAGYNTITNISSGGIESGSVITWSGLGITAGQSITLSFRAAVAATGPYTNLAQITAVDQYDIDSTPDNGVDTDGDGNEVDDSGDEDDGDGAVVTPPATATIGDYVWDDLDHDGIQSVGEAGVSGITVTLYLSGSPVATTTTDASGIYTFTNVTSNTYSVRFTAPGYSFTRQDQGGDDNADSDVNGIGWTTPITVSAGDVITNVDAGLWQPATIGDYVWNDLDHDGQQDVGEPGLPNVQVVLLSGGTPVATTTTNSSGLYTFTNVVSGSYTIEFTAPAGYDFTQQDQGSNLTDSDADSSGQTASFSVNAGQTLDTIDAGLWQPATIGGQVRDDADADGDPSDSDSPVNGVTVVLYSGSTPVMTTTTNGSGYYTFTNVVSGSYTIREADPSGYASTYDTGGTNDNQIPVTVNAGQTSADNDFLDTQPATVGDYVWNDLDHDGQQDAGEPGLPNVQVVLLSGGTPVATTTTSSSGLYTFTNVVSGSYTIEFTAPAGYDFTQQDQGSNLSDSDADSSGQTSSFSVNAGQTLSTIDAGLYQPATIGDYVWNDLDNDGQQDVGESGLPNVQVVLLSSGTPVATTTTSSSGLYTFTNVVSGSYTIEFTAPAGYDFTTPNSGDDSSDSDAGASGQTASFSVNAGQTLSTIDAGLYQPATIGDYVWNDLDNDGQQEVGEPGLPNVQVVLLSSGTPVATTTTSSSGLYTFTNVVSGSYTIEFTAPAGYVFTQQDQGSNLSDSDADSSGQTSSFTVNAGQTLDTIDAGLYQPATISGRVLEDADDSGDFSGSDTPLPGITIRLYEDANGDGNPDSATPVATQTTSSSGYYTFTNVVSGTYVIVETDLVTYTSVTDTQGANDNRISVSVNAGDTSTGNDFLDIPQGPAIEIAKTPDTQTIEYNGTVTFTITITNIGNVVLSPVEVIDIVSPDCTAGYGSLNPGWSESYTCVVTNVTANFINTAIVSGTSPTNDVVTDTDDAAVDVLVPAVGLAKSVGTVINNGDGTHNVLYTLVVENLGDVTLNNVTITDDLSITFAGSGGFAVVAGPTATTPLTGNAGYDGVTDLDLINAGTLDVSQVATVTFTVQVTPAGNMGPYTNTAYAEGVSPGGNPVDDQSDDGTDPDPDGDGNADEPGENDPTPVLFTQSGLSITKTLTSSSPVLVGQPVEFDIVIQNTGNITLTTVPVTDTYNTDYLAFVSASLSVDDATDDGQLNWSNVGPINPGESVTITVSFTAEQAVAGTTNTATASATDDNGDSVPEQTDDATVEIIRLGLDVNKSVSIARVAPNQVVTYTIDITNTGTVTLTSVIVTDTLENGLTYQSNSASPTQPSVNGQELVWTLTGGLPAGDTTRITFRASVTTTTGSYQNFVLAEGVHPTGTITDTDNVPVTVEDPTVAIDKGVVPPGVVDGLITFTVRITNTGPSTLDQVPLFDHFTGPVEYYSAYPEPDNVDNANGTLSWNDLTQNNTHGLGQNLDPGEAFVITTVFRLTTTDQEFSMTNEATVTSDTGNPAVDVLDNNANEPSDRVELVNEPTAITLLYFVGDRVGDNVVLNWATAVEINNFGFKLMRSTTGNFTDTVEIAFVNGQGSGTASGASYSYTDTDVVASQTYTYWLVDVDNNGTHTIHDPVTVEPTTLDGGGDVTLFLPLIFK